MISILHLFYFKNKTETKICLEKKFAELEKNSNLNTTKRNYCDLYCYRANVCVEWFVINSCSNFYENLHKMDL